jgi:hypothetical protein
MYRWSFVIYVQNMQGKNAWSVVVESSVFLTRENSEDFIIWGNARFSFLIFYNWQ